MRFSYSAPEATAANTALFRMPYLPLRLHYQGRSAEVMGLVDSGSAVNVLPYSVGAALGAQWNSQSTPVPLAGALGDLEARALLVEASHPALTIDTRVRLVFAWTRSDGVPVVLGQVNSFMEFHVCFYGAEGVFDVHSRLGAVVHP